MATSQPIDFHKATLNSLISCLQLLFNFYFDRLPLGPQRYTPPPGLGLEKNWKWLVWTIWWCINKGFWEMAVPRTAKPRTDTNFTPRTAWHSQFCTAYRALNQIPQLRMSAIADEHATKMLASASKGYGKCADSVPGACGKCVGSLR